MENLAIFLGFVILGFILGLYYQIRRQIKKDKEIFEQHLIECQDSQIESILLEKYKNKSYIIFEDLHKDIFYNYKFEYPILQRDLRRIMEKMGLIQTFKAYETNETIEIWWWQEEGPKVKIEVKMKDLILIERPKDKGGSNA